MTKESRGYHVADGNEETRDVEVHFTAWLLGGGRGGYLQAHVDAIEFDILQCCKDSSKDSSSMLSCINHRLLHVPLAQSFRRASNIQNPASRCWSSTASYVAPRKPSMLTWIKWNGRRLTCPQSTQRGSLCFMLELVGRFGSAVRRFPPSSSLPSRPRPCTSILLQAGTACMERRCW